MGFRGLSKPDHQACRAVEPDAHRERLLPLPVAETSVAARLVYIVFMAET